MGDKVYLVAEDWDHGPGYGLGKIHRAFKDKGKAEQVAKEMDKELNDSGFPIPSLHVPDLFYVMEIELEQ
jgi:hypothetical protein